MSVVKDKIDRIVHEQPDDSSYEEILKELAFARMVDKGLADSEAGRTISNTTIAGRIKAWHK